MTTRRTRVAMLVTIAAEMSDPRPRVVDALAKVSPGAVRHELVKDLGETRVADQGLLTRPTWDWGSR